MLQEAHTGIGLLLLQQIQRAIYICHEPPAHQIGMRTHAVGGGGGAEVVHQVEFQPEGSAAEAFLCRQRAHQLRAHEAHLMVRQQQEKPLGFPGESMLQQQPVRIFPIIDIAGIEVHGCQRDTQSLLLAGGGFIAFRACHQRGGQSGSHVAVVLRVGGHAGEYFFCRGQITFAEGVAHQEVAVAALVAGKLLCGHLRSVQEVVHAPDAQQLHERQAVGVLPHAPQEAALHRLLLLRAVGHELAVDEHIPQACGQQLRLRVGFAGFIPAPGFRISPHMGGGRDGVGEAAAQTVEHTAVCPAVVHELHHGFRAQMPHAVLADEQRPEPVAVEEVGQRGGVGSDFVRFSFLFQQSQLQGTAVQRHLQIPAAAAHFLIIAGKAGALFIDEHINAVLRHLHVKGGGAAEVPLRGDVMRVGIVRQEAGILCQREQHQRGKSVCGGFLLHLLLQRGDVLRHRGRLAQPFIAPLREEYGGAVRHFFRGGGGVVQLFPGGAFRCRGQQVAHGKGFHFRRQGACCAAHLLQLVLRGQGAAAALLHDAQPQFQREREVFAPGIVPAGEPAAGELVVQHRAVVQQAAQHPPRPGGTAGGQQGGILLRRAPQAVHLCGALLAHLVQVVAFFCDAGGYAALGIRDTQHVFGVKVTHEAEGAEPVLLVGQLLRLLRLVGLEHVVDVEGAVTVAQVLEPETVGEDEQEGVHIRGAAVLHQLFHLPVAVTQSLFLRLFPGLCQQVEGGLCGGTGQGTQCLDGFLWRPFFPLFIGNAADVGVEAQLHLLCGRYHQPPHQQEKRNTCSFHRCRQGG